MTVANVDPNDADFNAVAWHEAGHAVISLTLGVANIELSLEDAIVDGYSARGVLHIWGSYLDQYESIPIMLAGYLAERKLNPNRVNALKGAERDLEFVRALDPFACSQSKMRGHQWRAETYRTPRAWALFLMGQVRVTMRILSRHHAALEGVAQALLERTVLSPGEVAEVAAVYGLHSARPSSSTSNTPEWR